MIKAVIFDFDGTLADTLPICFTAFQRVFIEYDNRSLSTDEIKAMFGPSETGIIRGNLISDEHEKAIELYYEEYEENHKRLVDINNDIMKMLDYLKEKELKLAIFTGKARRSLDISLKALGLDQFFEVIITGDDVVNPKPHPEGLNTAISLLDVKSSEVLFIGDSDADIEAGLRANVCTVGVQWLPNYQSSEFTKQPHLSFKNVADFKKLLEKGVHCE